jgi:hypothetical protein
MILTSGDLWKLRGDSGKGWIVIFTNIGWKTGGIAVMGKGTAKTAADMYPELPEEYGAVLKTTWQQRGGELELELIYPFDKGRLLLMPTVPLDLDAPWMSWKQKASVPLIKRGLHRLQSLDWLTECYMGIPGASKISIDLVLPLCDKILDSRFIVSVSPTIQPVSVLSGLASGLGLKGEHGGQTNIMVSPSMKSKAMFTELPVGEKKVMRKIRLKKKTV